jgi:hypothetical protein
LSTKSVLKALATVPLRLAPESLAVAALLDSARAAAGAARRRRSRGADVVIPAAGASLRARRPAYRDRALLRRIRNPARRWPYPKLVAGPDPSLLRPPMVLVSFQVGSIGALGGFLERLPSDVLALVGVAAPTSGRVRTIGVFGGEWQRIAATRTAVQTLRSGGFVFLVLGEGDTARVEATLFGRRISLPRGALSLARMTNAPVLPLAACWRGTRAEVEAGAPIEPGPEAVMAASLSCWLEGYLRRHPAELRPALVRMMVAGGGS